MAGKEVKFIFCFLFISILLVSIVSAGFLDGFWGKLTGKQTSEPEYELTCRKTKWVDVPATCSKLKQSSGDALCKGYLNNDYTWIKGKCEQKMFNFAAEIKCEKIKTVPCAIDPSCGSNYKEIERTECVTEEPCVGEGGLIYFTDAVEKECCDGLTRIMKDKSNDICVDCGNDVCDEDFGENYANCPEDCNVVCSDIVGEGMDPCLDQPNCAWDQETDSCIDYVPGPSSCSDPDGGLNYFVQAHTFGYRIHEDDREKRIRTGGKDACLGEGVFGILREHFCTNEGYISTIDKECEEGCSDGVCIEGGEECYDSDGGLDYFTAGTLTNFVGTFQDYCLDSVDLIERHCLSADPNNFTVQYTCPNGCFEGACLPENESNIIIEHDIVSGFGTLFYMDMGIMEGSCELMELETGGIDTHTCDTYGGDYNADGVDIVTVTVEVREEDIENPEATAQAIVDFLITYEGYGDAEKEDFGEGIVYILDETTDDLTDIIVLWAGENKIVAILIDDWDTSVLDDDVFEEFLYQYLKKHPSDLTLSGEAECSDSDGGINYYEQGHLLDLEHNADYTDFCHDGSTLREHWCGDENYQYDYVFCENGCLDGACIPSEDFQEITVSGVLVNQITGKPVEGGRLNSAYQFFPEEVVSGRDGNVKFTVNTDFLITEGAEQGKSDIGGGWYFGAGCYESGMISMRKNHEIWENGNLIDVYNLSLTEYSFGEEPIVQDISGTTYIHVGDIDMYPSADISIKSDVPVSFTVWYDLEKKTGGTGNSYYKTEHYLSSALPLNYEVFVELEDEEGNIIASPSYRAPLDAMCGTVNLIYEDGEFEWFLEEGEAVECESGCLFDGVCYPMGYRVFDKNLNPSPVYCDVGGKFRVQKTVNIQGDWATCQNDFECDSNVCSGGECIEVGKLLEEVGAFKRLGVRVVCRIMNPISTDEFHSCINDFLGTAEGQLEEEGVFAE